MIKASDKYFASNRLYKAAVTLGAFAAVVIVTGPGLFGETDMDAWLVSWQKGLLSGTCHQSPDRSYQINGVPMAACSRCYGFYWGLFVAWPVVSLFPVSLHLRRFGLGTIFVAMLIIALDVVFSMAGIWQNTLTSRFLTGLLLGVSLFAAIFFTRNERNDYGTRKA